MPDQSRLVKGFTLIDQYIDWLCNGKAPREDRWILQDFANALNVALSEYLETKVVASIQVLEIPGLGTIKGRR